MKRKTLVGLVLLASIIIPLAGCCMAVSPLKPAAKNERGWIGDEYQAVGMANHLRGMGYTGPLPRPLAGDYQRGVLLTALGSNAPARLADLREGDVIVELNHQSLSNSDFFLKTIDRAEPGAVLPVKAWRDGQTLECNVTVGRETWEPGGNLSIFLLTTGPLHLWPNPGFSLIVLGYEPMFGQRVELDSVTGRYLGKNALGKNKPTESEWYAWLVMFSVTKWISIVSQETVPSKTEAVTH